MVTGRRVEPGGARVVVVDDESHVADLYAEYLADDHEVTVAYGGEEALEVVDETTDVVLLDRRMPDRSGGDVLEAIREQGYDCRVVMVTAVEPELETVDMAFDDYVTKPVDRDAVVDVVAEQLLLDRYDARLDEYVRKRKKLELLAERKSRAELAHSDRYDALQVVVESLREDLERMLADHDLDPERTHDLLERVEGDAPTPALGETGTGEGGESEDAGAEDEDGEAGTSGGGASNAAGEEGEPASGATDADEPDGADGGVDWQRIDEV